MVKGTLNEAHTHVRKWAKSQQLMMWWIQSMKCSAVTCGRMWLVTVVPCICPTSRQHMHTYVVQPPSDACSQSAACVAWLRRCFTRNKSKGAVVCSVAMWRHPLGIELTEWLGWFYAHMYASHQRTDGQTDTVSRACARICIRRWRLTGLWLIKHVLEYCTADLRASQPF